MEAALNADLFDEALERRGVSLTKLAQLADLNPGTISRLRAGEIKSPSLAMARKVSSALGVEVDALWPVDGDKAPPTGPKPRRLRSIPGGATRSTKPSTRSPAAQLGARGGRARWSGMTPEARSEAMAKVSRARRSPASDANPMRGRHHLRLVVGALRSERRRSATTVEQDVAA